MAEDHQELEHEDRLNRSDFSAASDSAGEEKYLPSKNFLYKVTLISAIGGFLFGYDTGVISGALLILAGDYGFNDSQQELIVSMALIGAIVGSAVAGFTGDKFGRKPVVCAAAIAFIIGSILMAAANGYGLLLFGRFVVGLGIGVASNTVPIYIAEISSPESRGALVTINVLFITTGQFVSYIVASIFAEVWDGWRYMLGIGALPAIVQLIAMIVLVPETPRWLVSKGRSAEAAVVLHQIRPSAPEDIIESELDEISMCLRIESGGWRELLSADVRPALLVGISLQAFQQFVGINTVMYYSATILFMAGFEERTWAILLSDLVALSNAIFTIVSILLIDRVGRRPLLLSTLVGVVLGLALLGAAFFVKAGNTGYLALGALIIYVAFFAVGMGPIPWAVNSEIYPLRIRAVANSVATTVNWISNLVVSMTFLTVSEGFTVAGTFWTYGVVAIIAWIFFFFKLPETKGKTMEQIQFEMTGKSDGQIVAEESQDTTQSFGVELDEVEKV